LKRLAAPVSTHSWLALALLAAALSAIASGLVGLRIWAPNPSYGDQHIYLDLSRSLLAGRGYELSFDRAWFVFGHQPTAYATPGLPMILSLGGWLGGDAGAIFTWHLLAIVAAGVGAVALYALGTSLGGRACGVVTALLWALMPMRLFVAPMLLAEAVYIPLLLAAVALVALRTERLAFLTAGILLSLTFLIRGAAIASMLGLVLGVLMMAAARRTITWRFLTDLALLLAPVLLVAGAWTARNAIQVGAPVVTETRGDYQLFIGLDASTRTYPYQGWRVADSAFGAMMFGDRPDPLHGASASPDVQRSAELLARRMTEPERASRLRASTLQHVRDYPLSVAGHLLNMASALVISRPEDFSWSSRPANWPSVWSDRAGWIFSLVLVPLGALWLLLGSGPSRSRAGILLLIMLLAESLLLVVTGKSNEQRVRLLFNTEILPFAAAGIVLMAPVVLRRGRAFVRFAATEARA